MIAKRRRECIYVMLSWKQKAPGVMELYWDYDYYQPWTDNQWLVAEMLATKITQWTIYQCIVEQFEERRFWTRLDYQIGLTTDTGL